MSRQARQIPEAEDRQVEAPRLSLAAVRVVSEVKLVLGTIRLDMGYTVSWECLGPSDYPSGRSS